MEEYIQTNIVVAEGDVSWHGRVSTEEIEWTPKGRDVEAVTNNDNFVIYAELGGADPVNL